jgi:DNA-binding PadR family transcriptional regulator
MAIDVRAICLALLSGGPKTGYEIKKSFEEGPLGYFIEASFGSIYPALGRLTEEGLVECRTQPQDGKPDRKIYSMTPEGQRAFKEALQTKPGPDKYRSDFLFILLFAEHLPPQHLKRLIDERLEDYQAMLKRMEAADCAPLPGGIEFVRGQGIAYFRAIIDYIEKNRHLVENRAFAPTAHAAE